jgi:D-alanine--poly(phosphoribitol) ligase subunit 1
MSEALNLAHLFHAQQAERIALVIDDTSYSYEEITGHVTKLARYMQENNIHKIGIFAARSLEAYVAVLAAQWIGAAFIPLNTAFPEERLKKIIAQISPDVIVVDQHHAWNKELLPRIINLRDLPQSSETLEPAKPASSDLAYLIFTSGSSGEPKGVAISYGNLEHFIAAIRKRYSLTADDRVSQFSSLCFDVSLFDMCLAWNAGAALYVVPEAQLLAPAKFIRDNNLTVWLGVPATISLLEKLNMVKPNTFPSLKFSLFTGEALTLHHALQWQLAAPNSQIENLYGPTEATIDCLGQVFKPDISYQGSVPIGTAFANVYAALLNENYEFVSAGDKGELAIAGPQVSAGYWLDEKLTQEKFQVLKHPEFGTQRWYLTGDYCLQDKDGKFYYLYRLDNQVKILGNRIELNEVEYYLRTLTQATDVAVVIFNTNGKAVSSQIVALICKSGLNFPTLKKDLQKYLPNYMLPAHIIPIDHFPYNSNGKIDRKKLMDIVSQKLGASGVEPC